MTHRGGMVLMLLAAACIGVQAYFVKLASRTTGAAEVAFIRFLASYLIVRLAASNGWVEIRVVNRPLVLARGVLGGVGNLLYFYAIASTRLSNAIVLLYTYPIFASLYEHFQTRKTPTPALSIGVFGALAASFGGIYLIIDPSFRQPKIGDLFGVLSGMTVAGAIVSLKASRKTDSTWTIFHFFNIAGIVLSLPLVIGSGSIPPVESLGPLAGVIVFSLMGQVGMTHAYYYTSTAEGSVVSMFGAVVGSALGIALLGEPARTGFVAGTVLVVVSGIYLTVRNAFLLK